MKPDKSKIQFIETLVKESNIVFKHIGVYNIDLDFSASGIVKKSTSTFTLFIGLKIKEAEDKFAIDILTESKFLYSNDLFNDDCINSYFVLNAPAIVFPYIRAYISGLTALSGMPTLTLPTLNLSAIGNQLKDNIEIVE
ncbi:MAG: protein-export chaperone SecB [Bacteroidales bacterium]|nr:protein-export chaperone SecB [Bacteroidales bacterium]